MPHRHGHFSAKNGYPKGSRTYLAWQSMRNRCLTKSHRHYARYKDKKIYARWANFANFLKDMGECPMGKTLDRIDNAKGYSKKNCRWATPREQAQNRSNSIFVTYRGRKLNLAEWTRVTKIGYETLRQRYRRGVRPPLLFSKRIIGSRLPVQLEARN